MNERDLQTQLDELQRSYHVPGEPPTELMWARIQQRRRARRASAPRVWGWMAAAAAILILGIGIGRMSVTPPSVETVAEAPISPTSSPTSRAELLQRAAHEFLARSEVKLTEFQVEPATGRVDAWASAMLTQTRFFLDTPLVEDPELHMLLLDLEFVFAQIVEAAGTEDPLSRDRIVQNMTHHNLMLRVRSTQPADSPRDTAQEGRL